MTYLEQLYKEWTALQPLKPEDRNRLDRKFMLEFNYNSNHIEGNTLTYGQTELLLFFGKVVDEANMKDLEEMKAHNVCLKMIQEEAGDKNKPLTETFIRQLHHTLLREDYTVYSQQHDGTPTSYIIHAGIYKTRPNSVITQTGERFEYASPEETPALMNDLVSWYNEAEQQGNISPIELASVFHYRYIRIHPFEDGNGRISRLLVNYILTRHGYPMLVVKSKDKSNYLTALNRCDVVVGPTPSVGAHAEAEQLEPFITYMSKCLERALLISIKAARGESIEEEDDFKKQIKLLQQIAEKKENNRQHFDSIENKIDLYNKLLIPYSHKMKEKIQPSFNFFEDIACRYSIGLKQSNIDYNHQNQTLDSESLTYEDKTMWTQAKSISFSISLSKPKADYAMQNVSTCLSAIIQFFAQGYMFHTKKYAYGTYPDTNDINLALDWHKQTIISIIEKAIKDYNPEN